MARTVESVPMTPEGQARLSQDLAALEARRPRILEAVKTARERGDLSENAEYHAAREELAVLEARSAVLRGKLARAQVIDGANSRAPRDAVAFGATVKVRDLDRNEEEEFTLVGPGEDDFLANKIAVASPIGRALLTRRVGDEVAVAVPRGTVRLRVLEIRYGG